MVTARQTVVQPLGLVLTPNTYGQYPPGALNFAENVVMRAPGELWQAPGFGAAVAVGNTNDLLRKLMPLDSGHVYSFVTSAASSGTWNVVENGSAAGLPAGVSAVGLFQDTGQIWPVRARERMLVNTLTSGVFVGDFMAPANGTQRALRYAGMPQPHLALNTGLVGSVIPAGVTVGYASLLKRPFTDTYQVVSVPGPVITISVGVSAVDLTFTIRWSTTSGVAAGDIIEVYRTDGVTNGGATNIDPGETLKLIHTHPLTSGEVAAGSYTFADAQVMQAPFYQTTGRELYTNPGQETALQTNRQPNISNAVAKFKSFVFCGDISERPAWTFAIPAGVSDTATPSLPAAFRALGIGIRRGAGTITSGSNTITAISGADIVGIKIGQKWAGSTGIFAAGAFITAVGASTVTLSSNALSGAAAFVFKDVILVDGAAVDFGSYADLMGAGMVGYEITADNAINVATLGYVLGTTVTFEPVRPTQSTMTIAATNGANYQPPVPEYNATAQTFSRKRTQNLLQWSKDNEPEHVPPSNEINIGAGTIIAMAATKNALWIFCTDGLFRLSGDSPPWRVDLVDPSLILVAPQAVVQLRDTIYAYTNYGMAAITDTGIDEFTTNILDSVFVGPAYSGNPAIIVERNELDSEVIVSINDGNLWVYNTVQKAWTLLNWSGVTTSVTALAFQRSTASGPAVLLIGDSVSSFSPAFQPWNSAGVNYLDVFVIYQPLYGDDPLVMKQYVDETFIFSRGDSGKTVTVSEGRAGEASTSIASAMLVTHSYTADAMATIGFPRSGAIAQASTPGFSMVAGATQFKFRGLSQRYVNMTDQAWRK